MAELTEPSNRLYTVDGEHTPVPDDLEALGPAQSQTAEDAERVAELNRQAEEVVKAERKQRAEDERAKTQAPKPSELLAQREGREEKSKSKK